MDGLALAIAIGLAAVMILGWGMVGLFGTPAGES